MIMHLLFPITPLTALFLLIFGTSNKLALFLSFCRMELSMGEYKNASIALYLLLILIIDPKSVTLEVKSQMVEKA